MTYRNLQGTEKKPQKEPVYINKPLAHVFILTKQKGRLISVCLHLLDFHENTFCLQVICIESSLFSFNIAYNFVMSRSIT